MKKCIGSVGLLFSVAVHAQSSVTLYGVVDATFAYVSNEANKVGAPGAKTFQLSNGAQSSSRWGIKVNEDLGAGTSAVATLESGFSVANGSMLMGGRLFGRQAFVGLSNTTYGTATFGRQYDFGIDYVGGMTAARNFATQWGTHVGDSDNLYSSFRINNAVKYVSSEYAGFRAGAMYAFSNQGADGGGTGFANDRAYSAGLTYTGASLSAAVTYTVVDNPSAGNAGGNNTGGAVSGDYGTATNIFYLTPVAKQQILNSGVRYVLGQAAFDAVYSNVALDYMDGSALHLNNYEANATYRVNAALLLGLGYTFTDGHGNGGDSTHLIAKGNNPEWHQVDIGAVYSVSVRTSVYLVGLWQQAAGDAQVAALNAIGGPSGLNCRRQVAVLTGLRHVF
jgi:general bacterial porin, GBP family